jgi:hypothetical protein
MLQGGVHGRSASIDTNRGSTIMIQMMMSTPGGASAARSAQQRQALKLRKLAGFAIVLSGLAVIVTQAVQHVIGA